MNYSTVALAGFDNFSLGNSTSGTSGGGTYDPDPDPDPQSSPKPGSASAGVEAGIENTTSKPYLYRMLYTLDPGVLGRRIGQRRQEKEVSEAELSRAARCEEAELADIEAGLARPIMSVVKAIAARLEQPLEILLRPGEVEGKAGIEVEKQA